MTANVKRSDYKLKKPEASSSKAGFAWVVTQVLHTHAKVNAVLLSVAADALRPILLLSYTTVPKRSQRVALNAEGTV